jgi:S-formylglutathione hydrolase FrmB
MPLIQCDFFSDTLRLSTSMTVILPQATWQQVGLKGQAKPGPHPVLFLLHGLSDDHSIWLRRTSIERYVAPLGIAVVMPRVARSWYLDMKYGNKYWTFISEELPALARSFFPLSDRREDTYVAGLSMGGYGALKLGLRCPERFAAAAALSPLTDLAAVIDNSRPGKNGITTVDEAIAMVGPDLVLRPEDNLYDLVAQGASNKISWPALYQSCGKDDFLYQDNIRFQECLRRHGVASTWSEIPGAGHDWSLWDAEIQKVLAWLPRPPRPE